MLIFKNALPMGTLDFVKIRLPAKTAAKAAELIFHLDIQYGEPRMWYQADASGKENVFTVLAIGTGHPWGDTLTKANYIGTLPLMDGALVLHYFIVEGDLLEEACFYAEEAEKNIEEESK